VILPVSDEKAAFRNIVLDPQILRLIFCIGVCVSFVACNTVQSLLQRTVVNFGSLGELVRNGRIPHHGYVNTAPA
jgi:hypothetical protein